MDRTSQKGFTLIEMIIVVVIIGIIGSMAATMLFQGAKTFVGETDRQGFVSESRSAKASAEEGIVECTCITAGAAKEILSARGAWSP